MMITIGKHVADFKQTWFRRSMHISFIKGSTAMWMALTCFQVAVPSCWDICTCQWDQRDFGPSTNTTSLHRSFRRIYTFWQSNHGKSMENPGKIHGKSMEHPKIYGKSMGISAEFPLVSVSLAFLFLDGHNGSKYPLRPDVPRWGNLDLWRPERGTSSCHLWSWPNTVWLGYFTTKNIKHAMINI